MSFLHPEFLLLAPLLAIPILIHLLNRVRYRKIRWAAIEFLLATERRAVRRARLRQILLMVLRTLVLAAALGALAQPIFSGAVASLLGGSSQVAVLVDASASMSAEGAGGSAFDQAKTAVAAEIASLPRGTRAAASAFALRVDSTFREPIQDHAAVADAIRSAEITGAGTDVPQAILNAAETLHRGGGGGTIWMLTDLRASGWQAGGAGAWDKVRQALDTAGHPRLIISDVAPPITANRSISKVALTPEILMEGDEPHLIATVKVEGTSIAPGSVRLVLEDKSVDTRPVPLTEAGSTDIIFRLPALKGAPMAGYLELDHDAMPGDDRHYFLLRPTGSLPVLVVSGTVSPTPFESSGDFLAMALQPPALEAGARSPFAVKSMAAKDLAGAPLSDYVAVCLVDVPRLDSETVQRLRTYVEGGGLVIVFPGARTDKAAWNEAGLWGARIEEPVQAEGEKRLKVSWVSPNSPVTATLMAEGMDLVQISRYFRMAADPSSEVLATIDGGAPWLVRSPMKRGSLYAFSVSAQQDFSNLPFQQVFLVAVHRMLLGHLGEKGEAVASATGSTIELPLKPNKHRIIMPDGRLASLAVSEDRPGKAIFDRTDKAGLYRLAESESADALQAAVPIRALNPPPDESSLARIEPGEVRKLLAGSSVYFLAPEGNISDVGTDTGNSSAVSGFPLAALALLLLLGEVVVAWTLGRPVPAAKKSIES
jgi:hypothetical protein